MLNLWCGIFFFFVSYTSISPVWIEMKFDHQKKKQPTTCQVFIGSTMIARFSLDLVFLLLCELARLHLPLKKTKKTKIKSLILTSLSVCLLLFSRHSLSVCLSLLLDFLCFSVLLWQNKGNKRQRGDSKLLILQWVVECRSQQHWRGTGRTGGSLRTRPWDCWQQIRVRGSMDWGLNWGKWCRGMRSKNTTTLIEKTWANCWQHCLKGLDSIEFEARSKCRVKNCKNLCVNRKCEAWPSPSSWCGGKVSCSVSIITNLFYFIDLDSQCFC